MPKLLIWGLVTVAALVVIDRLLLWMESRNWIYYRRTKGRRGGGVYHTLEIHRVFDPGIEHVIEAEYHEEQEQDESGDPPGPDGEDAAPPLEN